MFLRKMLIALVTFLISVLLVSLVGMVFGGGSFSIHTWMNGIMVVSIFILPLSFIWCVLLSYISDKFTSSPQSKSLSFIIQFGSSLVLILILFLSINQDPQGFGDVIFNGLTMGIVVTTILYWILDHFVID